MKKSKASPSSKTDLAKLQVREYIGRYHPNLRDAEIAISADGTFAGVRERPRAKKGKKAK